MRMCPMASSIRLMRILEEKQGLNCTKEKAGLWENLPTIRHVKSEAEKSLLINMETKPKFSPVIKILDNETDRITNVPYIFKWALCEVEVIKIPVICRPKTVAVSTPVCEIALLCIPASNS